jgi:hypothetical protein
MLCINFTFLIPLYSCSSFVWLRLVDKGEAEAGEAEAGEAVAGEDMGENKRQ